MECKRCGRNDHPNATWLACPANHITRKVASWDGNSLAECVVTDAVLAGFVDADGWLGRKHGRARVVLSQARCFGKDVLDLLQLYIGAGSVSGPHCSYERYSLEFSGLSGDHVLEICQEHGVLKPTINLENITDEWLGGFFAGDGCATRDRCGPRVSISQGSHPAVLHAIANYLGFGTVHDERQWICCGGNARAFALRFSNFALHKRTDLLALL